MQLISLVTSVLKSGDDLLSILMQSASFQENDILVLSSKVSAMVEGSAIDLTSWSPSDDAKNGVPSAAAQPNFAKRCYKKPNDCTDRSLARVLVRFSQKCVLTD
jgi:F420-0:gamma-glutamyl ligase